MLCTQKVTLADGSQKEVGSLVPGTDQIFNKLGPALVTAVNRSTIARDVFVIQSGNRTNCGTCHAELTEDRRIKVEVQNCVPKKITFVDAKSLNPEIHKLVDEYQGCTTKRNFIVSKSTRCLETTCEIVLGNVSEPLCREARIAECFIVLTA